MHHDGIQFLEWDTQQLGIKTAKINADCLSDLLDILPIAKSQGIKLAYWAIDQPDESLDQHSQTHQIIQTAKLYQGILVDYKLTYLINLVNLKNNLNLLNKSPHFLSGLKFYTETVASPELIKLAYESGKYSRFRADKNLTDPQFKKIYTAWINNSVNKTLAQDILIILSESESHPSLAGMVTVGEKNHCGDIGLLAVAEQSRGKHIGTRLVQAAQRYFIQKKYHYAQVVTQKSNIPACRLYEKCGYLLEKTELFFHFWL